MSETQKRLCELRCGDLFWHEGHPYRVDLTWNMTNKPGQSWLIAWIVCNHDGVDFMWDTELPSETLLTTCSSAEVRSHRSD